MKKLFLLFAFAFASIANMNAQHDLKVNTLGFAFGNYGGAYEYVLSDNSGINFVGAYFSTPKALDKIFDFRYTGLGLTAEYRLYVKKTDEPASGFFVAPYLKYSRNAFEGIPIDGTIDDSLNINIPVTDITANKVALGIAIGSKKISSTSFIYGWYFGIGRNLVAKRSFSNPDITESQKDALTQGNVGWQWRLGINVGYRFGGG